MMTEKTSKHIDAAAASPSEPAAEKKLTPLRHAEADSIQIADFRSII